MPLSEPVNPGKIWWSGDNPGILLKETEDGPWTALALFFRTVFTPEGRGHALFLYEQPNLSESLPAANNVVITDNEKMARWLADNFVGALPGAFSESPAFKALKYIPLTDVSVYGDTSSRYVQSVKADGIDVELIWDQLGTPTALELSPEHVGTRSHEVFNLLIESRDASIKVNGRPLPGRVMPRDQAGIKTTTGFVYFSEVWIIP